MSLATIKIGLDAKFRQLKAKLDPRYVKTRNANGANLSYIDGWHAIPEANRIFGFMPKP